MDNKNIITGIDIGTTKIAVIIAEKNNNTLNRGSNFKVLTVSILPFVFV